MPTIIQTKTVESFEILGFECDKCKTFYPQDHDEDGGGYDIETQEVLHWHHVGGYGALIGDGNFIDISLCQKCWYELFKPFADIKIYGFDPETGEKCYENTRKV